MVSLPQTWVEFVEQIHIQYISVQIAYNQWSLSLVIDKAALVILALGYESE